MRHYKILILIYLFSILFINCKPQGAQVKNYKSTLDKLMLNYTLDLEKKSEKDKEYLFEVYNTNEEDLKNNIRIYKNTVKIVRDLDPGLLYYLTELDSNKPLRENWVRSVEKSISHTYAYYTEREVSMLLIDFYLTERSDLTIEPSYYKKMSFKKVKSFLNKNKNLSKDMLKDEYSIFVKKEFK